MISPTGVPHCVMREAYSQAATGRQRLHHDGMQFLQNQVRNGSNIERCG